MPTDEEVHLIAYLEEALYEVIHGARCPDNKRIILILAEMAVHLVYESHTPQEAMDFMTRMAKAMQGAYLANAKPTLQ